VRSGASAFGAIALGAVAVAVATGACHAEAPHVAVSPSPQRCEVPLVTPAGFHVTGGIDDRRPDHVGVRVDLVDDGGRELHYFSGIAGEFGEGLAPAGSVRTFDGTRALVSGSGQTWVVSWERGGPCASIAVLGTGMSRRAFRDLLRQAGALADD
jgi:hypothetical protein